MEKYWLVFYGIGYAGMTADNNCDIFYGTREEADSHAYDMAVEECNTHEGMNGIAFYTDDEDLIGTEDEEGNFYESLEDRESVLDYEVKEVTLKRLENHDLDEEFVRRVSTDGYIKNWKEYLAKLANAKKVS